MAAPRRATPIDIRPPPLSWNTTTSPAPYAFKPLAIGLKRAWNRPGTTWYGLVWPSTSSSSRSPPAWYGPLRLLATRHRPGTGLPHGLEDEHLQHGILALVRVLGGHGARVRVTIHLAQELAGQVGELGPVSRGAVRAGGGGAAPWARASSSGSGEACGDRARAGWRAGGAASATMRGGALSSASGSLASSSASGSLASALS
eukprot:CAMPEP_0202073998 /NCGR_PEP_ID=MMETSP0964-20121228/3369_1 /ASSEMBLY_ACC=CAM_ASM_000500 /TAXON_ID=4773 /ORGANISM="Schizochytrium aggregatum, Strain ATCC28209" /LENGTH=201 /DNA_ID=CAMNT_0048641133 /DNA_START=597 /DNA_END=1200 /DNA_ORIENTATION=-